MKGPGLERRERRVLVAGAVVIAAALTATRGVPAWWRWTQGVRASASETEVEAARVERSVGLLPATLDTLEQRKERFVALAPDLLSGRDATQAAVALTALVSQAAQAAGMQLGALSVSHDSAGDGLLKTVAVRGDARGDVHGVMAFLGTLERGPLLLAVRDLAISQAEPAAPASRPEELRVQFRVEGLAFVPDTLDGS